MKTQFIEDSCEVASAPRHFNRCVAWIFALVFLAVVQAPAAIRSSGGDIQGFYQVVASNDPLFPMDRGKEWFLDFGKAGPPDIHHGSVSVSLRQNPNLKIRLFAWQYFAKTGVLVIGNPTEPGSNQAVVRASWSLRPHQNGMRLERLQYSIALRRADPSD